jgi:hypothetical protein
MRTASNARTVAAVTRSRTRAFAPIAAIGATTAAANTITKTTITKG